MDLQVLYINYELVMLYIFNIQIIQKYFRFYQFMRNMRRKIHQSKSFEYLNHIIEIGYLPPDKDYPLLKRGGFHYRESETNFYLRIKNM